MTAVSIARVVEERIEEAVRQAVELAGGFPPLAGAVVLIKPNVVSPCTSGSGKITDARVTEAVTRVVLEESPECVIIGEGSSVGYDFPGRMDSTHCLEVSGTAEAARRLGVGLVDLNRDEIVEVHAENAFVMETFGVARTALEADVTICLPVLKTHVRTGITCGLKNMKGVLPGDEKKRTHRLGLDRAIVDLNRVVKPQFTVVDAIVCMEGTNTYPDDCVRLDRVFASADVVAVDAVSATATGFDVDQILHVKLAGEEGLGEADLNRIEVCGESLESTRHPFVPHQAAARAQFGDATIVEKDTCTGCMAEMLSTFIYLNRAGLADRLKDLTLVLGTPDEVTSTNAATAIIGKCARAFRDRGLFVPGCPPHAFEITDAACRVLGIDRGIVRRTIEELHDF